MRMATVVVVVVVIVVVVVVVVVVVCGQEVEMRGSALGHKAVAVVLERPKGQRLDALIVVMAMMI